MNVVALPEKSTAVESDVKPATYTVTVTEPAEDTLKLAKA